MKTRTKIVLTIAAAAATWLIFNILGLNDEVIEMTPPQAHADVVYVGGMTVGELQSQYASDNEEFFGGKLPKDVVIDYTEMSFRNMATTRKDDDGRFHIRLNPFYAQAERIDLYLLLHESCHIKEWDELSPNSDQKAVEHGRRWRSCMLHIDAAGRFRELFIDGYQEKTQ